MKFKREFKITLGINNKNKLLIHLSYKQSRLKDSKTINLT